MTIHASIDLETIDTQPSATVLSLGAVKFNPLDDSEPHSEMYFKINIDEQDALGRTTSDDTIAWWANQDPAIMEEAFDQEGAISVEEALIRIRKFVGSVDTLWGQGYGFDYTIIENMFRSKEMPIPYNFWQVKDSRTLFGCCESDPRKKIQNSLHNALADAYYQSKAIQIAYKELGIKR